MTFSDERQTNAFWLNILLFIGFVAVFVANSLFGQEYFAKGQIEVVTKLAANSAGEQETLRFYVEVIGNNFKIRIEETKKNDWYYEYAYENGLMQILHHIVRSNEGSRQIAGVSQTSNSLMFPARIEAREIPPNDGTRAQFVWFALASQGYFAKQTNEFILPIWSPEDPLTHRQPFQMLSFREMLPEFPHLPAKVDFVNDGFYRSYNPVTKALDTWELAAPYDAGYTNAIYQVLALTNTIRNSLPEEFVFAVYSSPVSLGDVPFERVVVRGTLQQVGDSAPEGAKLAKFTGVASVVDYRVGGEVRRNGSIAKYKYSAYSVTNAAWLNSNQLAQVKARTERTLLASKPSRNFRGIIWAVFGFTAISFGWLVLRSVNNCKLN